MRYPSLCQECLLMVLGRGREIFCFLNVYSSLGCILAYEPQHGAAAFHYLCFLRWKDLNKSDPTIMERMSFNLISFTSCLTPFLFTAALPCSLGWEMPSWLSPRGGSCSFPPEPRSSCWMRPRCPVHPWVAAGGAKHPIYGLTPLSPIPLFT